MPADGQGPGHVEIAVVAAPHSELDLGNEIRMVKAALLYADHVTLVSPNSAIMALMGGLASMPEPDRRGVAEALAMRSMTPEQQAALHALRSKKRPKTVEELLVLRRYDERLKRTTEDFSLRIAGMVVDAGGNELALAVQQGLVDVDTLGMEDGLGTEEVVQRYTKMLITSVGPSSSTMPLIDDTSGGLLRAFEEEQGLPDRPGRQPEEAGLAGYMVETVEAFPDATMAEVIDARGVLRAPLLGFRSAMASMAHELESAPWDRGFQAEARALYRREVAPKLEELRTVAEQSGAKEALAHHVARGSGRTGLFGGLTVAIAAMAVVPEAALAGAAFGAVATAADFASSIYRERRDLDAKRNDNKMLFLFEADRLLRRDT